MTNSLFIQKMSDYQHSELSHLSAKVLIEHKVMRSQILLMHFHKTLSTTILHSNTTYNSTSELLLYEARAARQYWQQYKKLLPVWTQF